MVWRQGTKGPLKAKFAAIRLRIADGIRMGLGEHLPGEEIWPIGERRWSGVRKYYVANLPVSTRKKGLVKLAKKRWACELMHREAKQEVGLSHFEGRS